MKLLIIHYHLQLGGVTKIIDSQLEAMLSFVPPEDITVLTGSPRAGGAYPAGIITKVLPELNYIDISRPSRSDALIILKKIEEFIKSNIFPDTVMHPHNLNLGKNPLLTYAINKISGTGIPVLNHCHDFAENGRPENLEFLKYIIRDSLGDDLQAVLYPDKPAYHFAVINSADMEHIVNYGARRNKVHLLPNPVYFPDSSTQSDKPEIINALARILGIDCSLPVFTYPVRAIRRKNIGEFILLASLFSDKANWLITMAPENPTERLEYDTWKNFCSVNKIKVHFEAGAAVSFTDLMNVSDKCITTSIKEGFGMVFLEPWLFGLPVAGRNIPEITGDFVKKGISFPAFYTALATNGKNDFPDLSQRKQMDFILSIKKSDGLKTKFLNDNPEIMRIFQPAPPAIIEQNRKIIKNSYSLESYGQKLFEIYKRLVRQP